LFALTIGLLAAISYRPVLANFLTGDDYAYLPWCKMAVHDPSMILTEFHRPWMNNYSNAFFRPMLTVSMALDYAIWGPAGFGFHLSNFLYLLVASSFLGLIIFEIGTDANSTQDEKQTALAWGFASAALFAVYPLHPEAISWMTGRVDCFTSMFILSSLWCYVRWRKTDKISFAAIATCSMCVALMSKETGITVPIFLTLYEFILGADQSNKIALKADLLRAVKRTAPFWGVLALYFVWRRIALGTFVGGYDNSLFFIADWKAYLGRWTEGLRNLVIPINSSMLGSRSWQTRAWDVGLVMSFLLSAISFAKTERLRKPILFLLTWSLASFIPIYKIFVLNNVLQGGRLVYLVTLPLCALMAFGFCYFSKTIGFRRAFALLGMAMLFLSTDLLYINNLAWAESGRVTNRIKAELNRFYHAVPGDPPVFVAGMPNQILGAHCCVNAQDGMTKAPQIDRDIFNLIKVDEADLFTPLGFLKQSMNDSKAKIKTIFWNSEKERLIPSTIDSNKTEALPILDNRLQSETEMVANDKVKSNWISGQGLHIVADSSPNKRPALNVSIGNESCWQTDFIQLQVKLTNPQTTDLASGIELLYQNDIVHQYDLAFRVHGNLASQAEQTVTFPLRSRATWTLGGSCRSIQLRLPGRCDLVIESIALVNGKALVPQISFAHSGCLENRGVLHFDNTHMENTVAFDATNIPNAKTVQFEITRLSQSFEDQNSNEPSHVILTTLKAMNDKGSFQIARTLFPSRGNYQARLRAFDSAGRQVGMSGDFILISVDD
jgi:hypothetical protein